ncbi:nucleotidyl transferase AbiEii/AbiGii toxin family protein [Mycoplasma yeatsii]|uniref:Nucleotidyltransferase component of viral defense system n=1 Tax=Mycoplasma yeatsii TaxID=51365 RepID=A0ABU0NE25_9MOLU|nr:nucleotidyl transferase AbiEii/AbiGii toxin family protein [Mycoplasma yeatsii]MDQ0567699.1 putative nucleotidyltransferase component of viral defense system [Mycoplasma yeatsii]
MNKFYIKSSEELETILVNTANEIEMHPAVVEKDYWVSFLLDYIFNKNKYSNFFTFKGGTSLSKCFNVIKRFSEDIDLILDWTLLGYETDQPYIEWTISGQSKFNTEMNKNTGVFLKEYFIKTLENDLKDFNLKFCIDKNDENTILCEYPNFFESDYLTQKIKLEIGCIATTTPFKDIEVSTIIDEVYPNLFREKSIIRVIDPERTFWEKALILHSVCNKPEDKTFNTRYARHYYDLYCLANSPYKDKALQNIKLLKEVTEFKKKFYWIKYANYDEVLENKKLKLIPSEFRIEQIRKDYIDMRTMFYGEIIEFDKILETLKNLEKEINDKLSKENVLN